MTIELNEELLKVLGQITPKCEISGLPCVEPTTFLCGLRIYVHPIYYRLAVNWLAKNENNTELRTARGEMHAAIAAGDASLVQGFVNKIIGLEIETTAELHKYFYDKKVELMKTP